MRGQSIGSPLRTIKGISVWQSYYRKPFTETYNVTSSLNVNRPKFFVCYGHIQPFISTTLELLVKWWFEKIVYRQSKLSSSGSAYIKTNVFSGWAIYIYIYILHQATIGHKIMVIGQRMKRCVQPTRHNRSPLIHHPSHCQQTVGVIGPVILKLNMTSRHAGGTACRRPSRSFVTRSTKPVASTDNAQLGLLKFHTPPHQTSSRV